MKPKNLSEIPKAYNPSDAEGKWYKYWYDHNLYHSEVDETKVPYTIVIPPPNITGILHIGHILNNTLQDIYIRYKRMMGFNACWVPGIDHASIATEAKVVAMLKEKGIDKKDLTREEFLKYCYEWKEKYGGIIFQQLRKLGVSCDWQRERFTMDEHYYRKVIEAFVKLYKEGYIYRGYRMVNWDPASKSAISDEEVFYKEVKGHLWHIKYPVKGTNEFLVVATTRPETMLGDTAVAVNPNDERYKHLIGKTVTLPIVGREIPVIADEYVDMEFGTGAVKVTPAHDVNDYEMGLRHNLEMINIFNEEASTNENAPEEFRNLDRYEARKKVVKKLEELGFLLKTEDYTHKVGYSQRGNVPIEPYLSEQWFMKMDELAKPALEVVLDGKIKFHPEHWIKTYEHWMTNIRDWCISRQLWWGHRIPVWYHKETGEIYCEVDPPADIENWTQDEDVLDTWASSWLWAQDVFTNERDQRYYYPTDLLVTAPDIIFFWVARMIIAGMHFMKEIPFKDVYFTSTVRDTQGRKMSKSLGNSPDPLDLIEEYGADALRFTMTYISPLGQDVHFSNEMVEIGRNFANKIWNAGRFLLMNAQNIEIKPDLADKHIDFTDRWIISRFNRTLKEFTDAIDNFEVNAASKILYSYVWNDFCDWYVELSKERLYKGSDEEKSAVLTRALKLYGEMLKMVHPFMPFITEEIWQLLDSRKEGESISIEEFPKYDEQKIDSAAEKETEFLQGIITAIRNIRGELNIPPSKNINVYLKSGETTEGQIRYIKALVKADKIEAGAGLLKPKASASSVVKECEIFVPLEGLIDLDKERGRIEKEIERISKSLEGVKKKLSNENFVSKAPADVVEREKAKQKDWETALEKLESIYNDLKG
ncbi:valyl-tRNA synthetase [Melioribacter roseus P3M-2]|uniref:Valine--tRNA ligase n=1 Tax=Melioribacter roseus (strain DSM 23840 / JCM 17771 / VKM B-2668 / P3M-2) TaxID=1191523 RepID=I6YVE8_MELRP|nr:valine--tRNA ligase [Melioribacter roseus]AFN74522.1 valyl-tRNA synthetase [Melioribacter roseus P3M-2]